MAALLEPAVNAPREYLSNESIMSWVSKPFPVLTDAQFNQWQALLEDKTGMYVSYYHRSLLQSNLIIRMREIECPDFDDYYAMVCAKPSGIVEWNTLLDRIMVQETRFYRNPESLELFSNFVREQIQRKPRTEAINIWSVGCCSGEEPYTLAMLCQQMLMKEKRELSAFGITATDISLPVLGKAREGIYNARKLIDLDKTLVDRYFDQLSPELFQVKNEIKQKVCFSMANMVDVDKSPLKNMDTIYCQNVLIYFRKELKHAILNSLVERLAPNGLLVIGQGEAIDWHNPAVERVDDNQTLAFIRRN
jgi:type IV pilus assembly protein PilK